MQRQEVFVMMDMISDSKIYSIENNLPKLIKITKKYYFINQK